MLATGNSTGSATITRQGALASIVGEGALSQTCPLGSAWLRPSKHGLCGALGIRHAGETLASLVANLGGSGDWTFANLKVPEADPAALDRAGKLLLAENEPFVEGRAESVIARRLNRAPLTASSIATSAALISEGLAILAVRRRRARPYGGAPVTFDLKSLMLDARGSLTARAAPPEWQGASPGNRARVEKRRGCPARATSTSVRSATVLRRSCSKRELEKIEAFEKAAAERQRQFAGETGGRASEGEGRRG